MERYIIACRFNHAFVCRAWVSKAKAHRGRRYGIVKNWCALEQQAIAAVQEQAGGWPAHGFFSCPPDLAGLAVYRMRAMSRTRIKRIYGDIAASLAEYEAK